eukprot:Hpha_TRINITY_DN16911_c2_g2::TRINITY_DN16911_c2_g2_i1::g.52364::m.52364
MATAPPRSSTPDAEMRRGSESGVVSDWVSSCFIPPGARSAPSSVTKGMALRSRAMMALELSPAMLAQRLSLEDRQETGNTPGGGVWGRSQALENKWTFWVDQWERQGADAVQDLQEVGQVHTMKEFWAFFNRLKASEVPGGSSVHLFRAGVRPTWEDERNLNGGHFRSVVQGVAGGRVWLKLALAAVGEQLEGADRVCGVSVARREYGTAVSVWIDSRDPALRDMVANQFATLTGDEAPPVFRPHRSMLQTSASPRPAHPQSSVARFTPRREDFDAFSPHRLRDTVFDAQAAVLPQRLTRSAPTSPCVHGLTPTVQDLWPSAMSTTFRRIQFGQLSPCTEEYPTFNPPVAQAPQPPAPSPLGERPKQQSKRALKAGVRCLNPAMVGAHTTGQAPTPSKQAPGSAVRRSHSDTDSKLHVPRHPISARTGASPQRSPARAFPRIPGMPSPPAFMEDQTEKTPLAWADAPWNPADLAVAAGSPDRPAPRQKVQMRPVPEPVCDAQDPHSEWQLHQRARDVHRTSPPPSERRGSGQGSGGPPRDTRESTKPTAAQRASAAPSGKSMSLGFVHKAYLFPAGLNRKQRRTIIFNGDRLRRGEVPEGIWVGEDVPDGPVTDEELATLKAGGRIERRVPLAALNDSAPASRASPAPFEDADAELLQLNSPALPHELEIAVSSHHSSRLPRSPSPPKCPPDGTRQPMDHDGFMESSAVDSYSHPHSHHSPDPFQPMPPPPGMGYDPAYDQGMPHGGEAPLRLRELNPDAAAFVPGGREPGAPPPVMMNGVPMMQDMRRMAGPGPPGMGPGPGPGPERVIIVRGHNPGGQQLVLPGDAYPPGPPPGQRFVTVQRPATHVVRTTAPGYGGGVVTHVRRVVTGPMPGLAPGARIVQTGGPGPVPLPMGAGGPAYVSPPGGYVPGPGGPPPPGPQVVRYVYHQ